MNKQKEGTKITLGMLKGKPVTTSVPSIAIKFHANAEQLEDFYPASDDERSNSLGAPTSNLATGASDLESSPLKLLPKLVKRSSSIDITPIKDSSPPSADPWRFFTDIKGKITKSVEDKLIEIKSRNCEGDGSPLKIASPPKAKEGNSSSEDLSESSLSKTCGLASTTEGAEMSSDDEDDETPSIDKDPQIATTSSASSLRQRFQVLNRNKEVELEGTVPTNGLSRLYNISTERVEQALPDYDEIESGVEALADDLESEIQSELEERILSSLAMKYDNIEFSPDKVIQVESVSGAELRNLGPQRDPVTLFAPRGFVDLRERIDSQSNYYLPIFIVTVSCVFYFLAQMYSNYFAGFLVGTAVTYLYHWTKAALHSPHNPSVSAAESASAISGAKIYEIQPVKEYQPLKKFEGWMNEFPEFYNPHTYHISQTQSVFLKLQGNLLRISHSRTKVPKRALWNEPEIKPIFTHHRVYNLLGAKITILPTGLAKKKHWSKKYPICIVLSNNQMNFDPEVMLNDKSSSHHSAKVKTEVKAEVKADVKPKKSFHFRKKPKSPIVSQRFSKLTEEEEEYELESDNSRTSSPSPDLSDVARDPDLFDTLSICKDLDEEDEMSLAEDWSTLTPDQATEEGPKENVLYLFGRTDREKEDWFRRFTKATHKGAEVPLADVFDVDTSISDILLGDALVENDYLKYMTLLTKSILKKKKKVDSHPAEATSSHGELESGWELMWINAFLGRVLFDLLHDPGFTRRVKERIERKLAAIKLPYFIEELIVTELSLGTTPPIITNAHRPRMDDRGLWIDLDVNYEGHFVMTLQTKINLMKLKQPPVKTEKCDHLFKSAMYHSDIDDSAESSSDDDGPNIVFQQSTSHSSSNPAFLDSTGYPVAGLGGTSNKSKKLIKIVDRIAESRFFQAATENRYIKKAMEGVSRTDLRLKVELRELVGTLVLNIPPPPSDRVWIGFRPTPDLTVSAHPIVGERNITLLKVTSWIEKKLLQEFQKVMVIPNMEDFAIPAMSQKLPQ